MKKLTIRKTSGKYYQIGYSEKGKWNLVEYVGTVETLLELVRVGKEVKNRNYQHIEITKTL